MGLGSARPTPAVLDVRGRAWINAFLLITARSYAFFKLLNVAILTLTALVGLRFLTFGMRALNEHVVDSTNPNRVAVPVSLTQRELVSATVGGAAVPAAQPPTNGDAPTSQPQTRTRFAGTRTRRS